MQFFLQINVLKTPSLRIILKAFQFAVHSTPQIFSH